MRYYVIHTLGGSFVFDRKREFKPEHFSNPLEAWDRAIELNRTVETSDIAA